MLGLEEVFIMDLKEIEFILGLLGEKLCDIGEKFGFKRGFFDIFDLNFGGSLCFNGKKFDLNEVD